MKIKLEELCRKHNLLSNAFFSSMSDKNSKLLQEKQNKDDYDGYINIKLVVDDDIIIDKIDEFFDNISSQIDKMIAKKAMKLIEEKFDKNYYDGLDEMNDIILQMKNSIREKFELPKLDDFGDPIYDD